MTEGEKRSVESADVETPFSVSVNPEPEEAQAAQRQSNDWLDTYFTSPAGRRIRLTVKGVSIFVVVIILVLQQLQFKDSWGRSCDYELKIWSTVWVCRCLLQHIIVFIVSYAFTVNRFRQFIQPLRQIQTLIFLFKVAWFFYGIKPVFVNPSCDSITNAWGLVLWCLELCVTIAPLTCLCLAACLCLPLLLYCLEGETEAAGSTQPTPKEVRDRLKIVKYVEIASEMEARQFESPQVEAPDAAASPDDGGILTDMAVTLAGMPLPDLNSLKRIPNMLGRQTPNQPAQTNNSNQQPNANVVGNHHRPSSSSSSPACPVCFSQFEEADDVVQMPCHPSHVFHSECLFSWLDNSQVCPVCRGNVVEAFQRKEEGLPQEIEKPAEKPEKPEKPEQQEHGEDCNTSDTV